MDENLGMNLFLGDEFMDESPDALNPNEHIVDNNAEDEDPDAIHNEEETDEDESQDEVGGNTEEEDENESDDDTSSPPLYKSLASHLHGKGVLASVDSSKIDNVKTIEDLEDLMMEQLKLNELADLTPLQKEAVEAFREGVSLETFQKQKQTEEQLDNITEDALETDEDLRKQIIFQNFKNKGYSDDKALKFTNRSFEVGEDINDAKESLEDIKVGIKERFKEQREYETNQKKLAVEAQEKERKDIESKILKTDEFAGAKLNEVARKRILDTMLVPVGKNPTTGEDENALMRDQRENKDFSRNLYTVYTLTKGFTDFSAFGKAEKTKTINDIEKALKNNQHVLTGGNASFTDDPNASDYDIGDNIVYR